MSEVLLPIFPLGLAPLPGEAIPLHIFEPRYQQLIRDCAPPAESRAYLPFGIHTLEQGQWHATGCTVVIEAVLHKYPDGQLDLITRAHQRYRLLEAVTSEKPYRQARVEWLLDQAPESEANLQQRVLALGQRWLALRGQTLDTIAPQLSFQLASLLDFTLADRLRLRDMLSENERLEMLCDYLSEQVPRLEEKREFQRRVSSNGHF
jgi:Lon protease-like protein